MLYKNILIKYKKNIYLLKYMKNKNEKRNLKINLINGVVLIVLNHYIEYYF